MLQLCRAQLRPSPNSLLFIVLPLPCVTNSRYTTVESFNTLVADVGFELMHERWKPNGKVAYWLWRWREHPAPARDLRRWNKKTLRNDGKTRNNFAILLE
jgi:25S rRNA (adenine2142-N1)-methyltransferase